MTEELPDSLFKQQIRRYAEILNPLFDPTPFMRSGQFFEFVCVILRVGGIQGPEWDPWYESQATLDDLGNLATLELPEALFPNPNRTRVRLSLLSYCHLTEMNFPYALAANLLRLRLGHKYDMAPFRDLFRPFKKKNAGIFHEGIPPSPAKKMSRIKKLAEEAKLPEIAAAFDSIYDKTVRNAVYHSDYTLSEGEFRLMHGFHLSQNRSHYTPVVKWEQLSELFANTFAFYTALFSLYDRCTKSFGDFSGAFMPYDHLYKGILQLILDGEGRLTGFRVYWPNETLSEYKRVESASAGCNLEFSSDGSANFFVGLYASKPGNFSPLVEHDGGPAYCPVPGTDIRPHWPADLKPYKLSLGNAATA